MSEEKFQSEIREVTFQEAGMKNFGPYIDPMVLKFENNKLVLLTGPNGIGKTMTLDSIPFTLFGITSKKAKGDEVVNNTTEKNCKTWVKFKVNEDQYLVTRYQKYSKYGNTVLLNKNGTDIKKGQKEVLPEIERLLCSQKAFMNTLMFGQKIKDFFTDLVDSDKKEIFRKILGLDQYTYYYKEATNDLRKISDYKNKLTNQVEINVGIISELDSQVKILLDLKKKFYEKKEETIITLTKSIEDNKRLLNNWENKLNSITIDNGLSVSEIDQELFKVQKEIDSLEKDCLLEVQKFTRQEVTKSSELREECNKRKTEIVNNMTNKTKELHDKESIIQKSLNELITKNQGEQHKVFIEISNLKNKQQNYSERIQEIKSNVLDKDISVCPTCKQDVSDKTKEKLIEKINNYKLEIENSETLIDELNTKKDLMAKQLKKESEKFYKQLSETKELRDKLNKDTEKQQKEVDIKLGGLLRKVTELVDVEKVKILNKLSEGKKDFLKKEKELKELKEKREKIDNEINEIKNTISSLNQNIKTLENQLKSKEQEEYDESQITSCISKKKTLEEAINNIKIDLQRNEKLVSIYEFWKVGFSPTGIPSMLIDDSIPYMNKEIDKYLELLTNGRYKVSFDTLAETKAGEFRDKIAVHVVDTHTKANSRVQLSGGQTRIIDIATILTLGNLQSKIQNVKFNILLFDEIFDALDHDNASYVSKVLNKLKIDKSIYVISHQHQDQLEPDEVLEFK